tara:strand:+ start:631 stop:1773 length:1143 start_codon:yes stop_codon:yes gene_type:complete
MRKILISEHQLEKLSKNLLNEWSYIEKAYDETVDYLSGNQQLNEVTLMKAFDNTVNYLSGNEGWIPDALQKGDGVVATYLRGESGIVPGDQTAIKTAISSQVDKFLDNFRDNWKPVNDKYLCVSNPELRAAVHTLIQNKNKIKQASGISNDKTFLTILKMAIATIGRETDYGQAFNLGTVNDAIGLNVRQLPGGDTALDFVQGVASFIRGKKLDQSLGPAQFTSDTWKQYGLHKLVGEFDQVGKMINSLKGAYYRIAQDYKLALERGIGTEPSINPIAVRQGKISSVDGTGNISLDLSILAHNMGKGKIKKYCKTNNPNYNAPCDSPNGIYEPKDGLRVKVDKNAWVPGYFPNLGSGALTSIGYVEEVAKRAKGLGCVKL